MKRLSFIAAALLCFVTAVSAAIRPAQPGIGGGGSSGVTTGSVTVLTPLILSGTEIQLPLVLSNLKTNLDQRQRQSVQHIGRDCDQERRAANQHGE